MHRTAAILLSLSVVGVACKRAPAQKPDVLSLVPATASAVVHGPSLVSASESLRALAERLEAGGGTRGTSVVKDLQQRLGFDPFTREGLKAAGFDPDGAFAIAVDEQASGNTWLLPVSDGTKALTSIEALARQVEQADRVKETSVDKFTVKTFSRPFGSREVPVIHAAISGGHAVMAFGGRGADLVAGALRVASGQSFAESALMKAVGPSIPATPIRFVVDSSRAGKISSDARAAERLVKSLVGGITPSANGLEATVIAELTDERRDAALASLFPKGGALPLTALIEPDVVAVGQGTLAIDAARQLATTVQPGSMDAIKRQAGRLGVDVEDALMGMTDGHYAGALYMAPPSEIAQAFKDQRAVQHQLLRFFPFVVMMRPKAGQTPQALVDLIKQRVTQRGMQVAAPDGEPEVMHASFSGGPSWRSYQAAAVGDVVLIGGGSPERFKTALGRLRAKGPATALEDGRGDLLMRPDASSALLRLPVVNSRLDEVLKQDLGEGAEALTVRALVQRARQLVGQGKDLWIELKPEGSRLRGQLNIRLQPGTP